jgi:hypothetical protein
VRRREIGPIGTASRVLGGLATIALPVALEDVDWWDVVAAAALVPVATVAATLVMAAYQERAPGAAGRRLGVCSPPACALIGVVFAAAVALGVATPASGDVAFWGFFGASMLFAAVRGDGGCEVLAFPNAITGRRDRIGCILYTPIDQAEARLRARRHAGALGAR